MNKENNKLITVNWEVPQKWFREHGAELKRTAIIISSLVGLAAIALTSYYLGTTQSIQDQDSTSKKLDSESISSSTTRLQRIADQINNAECGDALLIESSIQSSPQSVEPWGKFWNAIQFGDYPEANIEGNRLTISVGNRQIESISNEEAENHFPHLFSGGGWSHEGMAFTDGPLSESITCSRGNYRRGFYQKVDALNIIGGPGTYSSVTKEEAQCAVITPDGLTWDNHEQIEQWCAPFWGTTDPWQK